MLYAVPPRDRHPFHSLCCLHPAFVKCAVPLINERHRKHQSLVHAQQWMWLLLFTCVVHRPPVPSVEQRPLALPCRPNPHSGSALRTRTVVDIGSLKVHIHTGL